MLLSSAILLFFPPRVVFRHLPPPDLADFNAYNFSFHFLAKLNIEICCYYLPTIVYIKLVQTRLESKILIFVKYI